MQKPYVYVETNKSKDVQREAPEGARVAVHFPEIGRSIELQTDGTGIYRVTSRPTPGNGGEVETLVTGTLEAQ